MEKAQKDALTQGAIDLVNDSENSLGMPLFESADRLCEQEEQLRRAALADRAAGVLGPLSCHLFPRDVFNEDGSRQAHENGRVKLTALEIRRAGELEDARHSF